MGVWPACQAKSIRRDRSESIKAPDETGRVAKSRLRTGGRSEEMMRQSTHGQQQTAVYGGVSPSEICAGGSPLRSFSDATRNPAPFRSGARSFPLDSRRARVSRRMRHFPRQRTKSPFRNLYDTIQGNRRTLPQPAVRAWILNPSDWSAS